MTEPTQPPGPPDPSVLTTDALHREVDAMKELFDEKLGAAEKLRNEKFNSVDEQMKRAEEMRREQKADTTAAVEAALQSQKEATTKMEASVSDQLASLRSNFDTSLRGIQSSVSDLKDRITTLESIKQGQAEQKTESRQLSSGVIALIGIGITVLLFGMAVLAFISANAPPAVVVPVP